MIFPWYYLKAQPCGLPATQGKGKGERKGSEREGEGGGILLWYYYDNSMISCPPTINMMKYCFFFCGHVTIDSRPYDSKSTFSHDITMIFSWYFHEIISIISLLWPHPGFVVLDALQWDITMILLWSFHDFYNGILISWPINIIKNNGLASTI